MSHVNSASGTRIVGVGVGVAPRHTGGSTVPVCRSALAADTLHHHSLHPLAQHSPCGRASWGLRRRSVWQHVSMHSTHRGALRICISYSESCAVQPRPLFASCFVPDKCVQGLPHQASLVPTYAFAFWCLCTLERVTPKEAGEAVPCKVCGAHKGLTHLPLLVDVGHGVHLR